MYTDYHLEKLIGSNGKHSNLKHSTNAFTTYSEQKTSEAWGIYSIRLATSERRPQHNWSCVGSLGWGEEQKSAK